MFELIKIKYYLTGRYKNVEDAEQYLAVMKIPYVEFTFPTQFMSSCPP